MANTNMVPVVSAPVSYVNGLYLDFYDDSYNIGVLEGSCRDSTNTNDLVLSTPLQLNIQNQGPGGRDTSSALVANEFYAVYLIGDDAGYQPVSGCFSLSGVNPDLPHGYNLFRRIGWCNTKPNFKLERWDVSGDGQTRKYMYQENSVCVTATSQNNSWIIATPDVPLGQPRLCLVSYGMKIPTGANDILTINFAPMSFVASAPSNLNSVVVGALRLSTNDLVAKGTIEVSSTLIGSQCQFLVSNTPSTLLADLSVLTIGFSDSLDLNFFA